ncbi:ATPase, T2SS/T4P/T4SS family [Paenibacillus cymbidii]|uniref:ATPase, T2SS/T4P/T4SS family n=1 Tax=Paenibacillus cymbidii TaxID=1639034 RepID=UPI001F299E57|nr:ATPase, T2SS/T4P/T4SS family [Paenibacillus cymbidii]
MEEQRFSVLSYIGRLQRGERSGAGAGNPAAAVQDKPFRYETVGPAQEEAFDRLVDDIRRELSSPRGTTEEERQQYNDALNRAVLGYEEARGVIMAVIEDLLARRRITNELPVGRLYGTMAEAIFAEVVGLNVLELILKNREGLEEIQVVGSDIFEVRGGVARPSVYRMREAGDLMRIQINLVLFNNDTFNPRKRWAEVALLDGSRVTMTGFGFTSEPTLTIRFYTMKHYSLDALCAPELGTMSRAMRDMLVCFVRSYFNLVVIGPTNAGKTNLLKAMIAEMPAGERIVTIESRFELMLKRDFPEKNVVEYEAVEDDPQHDGKMAFKLALRQSPKRICHAEIRDADASVYVRACTRGHEGSMTTVHVNELEDVPEAIADMCMLDGRAMNPARLVKRIATYVAQIGIEMAIVDGRRVIVRIGEFVFEEEEVKVRDIAVYDYDGPGWTYPGRLTDAALRRLRRYDPEGLRKLQADGKLVGAIGADGADRGR